ncbi:MAG TPA: type IV pilus biogenesis/stability protein PilW [Rhodanobacteraceae bacterium]|nr:type IV pilus biogenesis/stability protein PilW [Rhodanobacteraceae bacterium]
MQRKSYSVVAVMAIALGLAACRHDPEIIKYPTPMTNLENAPRDSGKQEKQSAAQTHTQLAAAYMRRNDLKEAQTALNKALSFDDQYIPAHTMLAILDWRIGRLQDADKEFRAAIAIDPSNGDTNNNYGKFLCEQGKQQQAMDYFKRALADPFYKTPVVGNTNAGACLLKGGDYAGAATYLNKALQIDPNYGEALQAMAQLDYRKGDAFAARGYLQRFESAGQATPESLLLGYQIATRLGDKETAANYSNRLQDQFPNSAQAQSLNGSSP